ncbi:hypothetical protein IFM5058_01388 [Aspergillus udagawae]|nr:hypothetical protein IFM5058_01388 [Aspergillus udagawae]
MATQIASVTNSVSATAHLSQLLPLAPAGEILTGTEQWRQPRPWQGQGEEGKEVVFFLPTLGSRRCDVCVAARILAAVTAVSQNQGDLPPPPPPPPRPRGWQNRPRIPTAGTVVEIDAGCSTCNSKMQGEAQLRQVQGQEDERKQRVDSHHGEEKNTTCEADRQ